MEIFKSRLFKVDQADLSHQNNEKFILTYFQPESILELIITGCLIEYIEHPFLRNSFQLFYSVIFPFLENNSLLSLVSNFIINSKENNIDSLEISQEQLEFEIISISNHLNPQFQDMKSISSILNCSIIFQNSEFYFNSFGFAPKIHLVCLPYNEITIYGICLPVVKDNYDSQSTWKKIYRIKKLIKNYKETERPKKMISSSIYLSQSTNFKPSIPSNFPELYKNTEKKKNVNFEIESNLPHIEKFEAPAHLAHGFNIFKKYSKSITESTMIKLRKWQPNKFESEGLSKTQGGFKSGNFNSFDSQPLREKTFFYPFPDQSFIPHPTKLQIDQNSQEEHKLLRDENKKSSEQEKSKNIPLIEEKKLEDPSKFGKVEYSESKECKECSIYDYFEYIDFKCLCMMCFDCSMKSASLAKCIKCKSPLSKYEVNKLREYL